MSKFNKLFEQLAKINDRSIIWNNWLDYCIDINLIHHKKIEHDFKGNEETYSEMLGEWLLELETELENKPYFDMLGNFYEELVTSHAKSKNIGQFFTPQDVTNLMVKLTLNMDIEDKMIVNDCACGSARMLLSAYIHSKGKFICIGQDLDAVSCKMAVLNFWSHGVQGSILHMNTLTNELYDGWRVNKYLYDGIPVPHIEKIQSMDDAFGFIGVSNDPKKVKSLTINDKKVSGQTTLI